MLSVQKAVEIMEKLNTVNTEQEKLHVLERELLLLIDEVTKKGNDMHTSPVYPQAVIQAKADYEDKRKIMKFINKLLKERGKKGFATIDFSEIHKQFPNYIFNKFELDLKKEYEEAGWSVERMVDSDERDPSPRGAWWQFSSKVKM